MEAQEFAKDWEAAWNSHDLDRILSHYSENIVFRSAKAKALVGTGELRGRSALSHYWQKALSNQPNLRFRVTRVHSGQEMLVISYQNHRGVRAAETLEFGPDGKVVRASACHEQGSDVTATTGALWPVEDEGMEYRVDLWASRGAEASFRLFEDTAMQIMRRYGGVVLALETPAPAPSAPYERHHLWFPSLAAFDAYRADEDLAALSALRNKGIERIEVSKIRGAP